MKAHLLWVLLLDPASEWTDSRLVDSQLVTGETLCKISRVSDESTSPRHTIHIISTHLRSIVEPT